MADYEPGKMDIREQKKGYDAFWEWSIRTAIVVAVILVLMYFFLL